MAKNKKKRSRIKQSFRHNFLVQLAKSLRRKSMTPRAIRAALKIENDEKCDPPLPNREIEEILRKSKGFESDNYFLSLLERNGKEKNFKPLNASEILAQTENEIKWVWDKLIPEGSLFLLAAFMKVGKTELIYHLSMSIARGKDFLGFATEKTSVLILALEEHPRDVKLRLQKLGLEVNDPIYVYSGSFKNDSRNLINLSKFIASEEIGLVFMDTLSRFITLEDENNNAAMMKEISPLLDIARATGAAIGLIHHERKKGGDAGRGIRGGSALFGLVDQAFILDKRHGGKETQRKITILGRYADSPKEVILDYIDGKFIFLGNSEQSLKDKNHLQIITALKKRDFCSIKELVSGTQLTQKQIRTALAEMKEKKKIIQKGSGTKSDPYLYQLREK